MSAKFGVKFPSRSKSKGKGKGKSKGECPYRYTKLHSFSKHNFRTPYFPSVSVRSSIRQLKYSYKYFDTAIE